MKKKEEEEYFMHSRFVDSRTTAFLKEDFERGGGWV
jgi:hypothetical protein